MDELKNALGDAKPREKLGSEFWSPDAIGEALVGRIADFQSRKFGEKDRDSFALTPVIQYRKGQKPEGFVEIRVSLNSWLRKLIRKADVGAYVGIIYLGKKDTPAGKMFTYSVRDVTESKFRTLLEAEAPGLEIARLAEPVPALGEPESINEDDLPF